MRKSIFTDTERAWRALLLLAGPYHDARNGIEGSLDRFNEGLKELRLIHKPQQTVGGAVKSAEYFISYNGERLLLDKHIRGKDSRFNDRSEEHTSELQSLMRISYAVFCLTKTKIKQQNQK